MEKVTGVYFIINLINNKVYVGSSTNTESRKRSHFWELNKQKHKNSYLQSSYNKYGKEAFVFRVIEKDIPEDKLFERELYWINYKRSNDPKFGYNLSLPNADGSPNHSLETRERLRRLRYEYVHGRLTDDQYKELVENRLTYINRERQIENHNIKSICFIDKNTNILVHEFKSIRLAAIYFHTQERIISRVLNSSSKKSFKGFVVIFKDDYNPEKDYRIIPKYKLPKIIVEKNIFKGHPVIVYNLETNEEVKEFDNLYLLADEYETTRNYCRKIISKEKKLRGIYGIRYK